MRRIHFFLKYVILKFSLNTVESIGVNLKYVVIEEKSLLKFHRHAVLPIQPLPLVHADIFFRIMDIRYWQGQFSTRTKRNFNVEAGDWVTDEDQVKKQPTHFPLNLKIFVNTN